MHAPPEQFADVPVSEPSLIIPFSYKTCILCACSRYNGPNRAGRGQGKHQVGAAVSEWSGRVSKSAPCSTHSLSVNQSVVVPAATRDADGLRRRGLESNPLPNQARPKLACLQERVNSSSSLLNYCFIIIITYYRRQHQHLQLRICTTIQTW